MVYTIYDTNFDIFLKEDATSFYLLGAYMTDGNIINSYGSRTARFAVKDQSWVENIRDVVSPKRPVYFTKNGLYQLNLNGQILVDWFIKWGCVPNKSLTLSLTKPIPDEYFYDFLRGVIDGDGSILIINDKSQGRNYTKPTIMIYSASKPFIKYIHETIIRFGFKAYVHLIIRKAKTIKGRPVKESSCWRLYITGKEAKRILQCMYGKEHKIYLKRKRDVAEKIIYTPEIIPEYTINRIIKTKETIKLYSNGVPKKEIAKKLGIVRETVDRYLRLSLKKD